VLPAGAPWQASCDKLGLIMIVGGLLERNHRHRA
jgi:hypothetical protein